jgi:hypothetical protein
VTDLGSQGEVAQGYLKGGVMESEVDGEADHETMSCPRSSRGFSRAGSTEFDGYMLAIKLFCLNANV